MLALELGYIDVDLMLESISAPMFNEWLNFFSSHPFGENRADLRQAQTSMIIAQGFAALGGSKHKFKISEFMPDFKRKPKSEAQVIKEAKAKMMFMSKMHNQFAKKENKGISIRGQNR